MKRTGMFLFYSFLLGFALTGCGGKAPTGAGEGGAALPAAGLEFGYPVEGEPWYFVKCAFLVPDVPAELEAAAWSVDRVMVDGVRARDFAVSQEGREIDKNGLKAAGGKIAFDVKARSAWRPGSEASVRVDLVEPKSGELKYAEASGTAPAGKGYWDPAWKSYLALVLTEEHGFERKAYPVHATVGVLSNYLRSPDEIRVIRAGDARGDELAGLVVGLIEGVTASHAGKRNAAVADGDVADGRSLHTVGMHAIREVHARRSAQP